MKKSLLVLISICSLCAVSYRPLAKSSLPTASPGNSEVSRLHPWQSPRTDQARLAGSYGKLPLSFEVNRGQADPQVKFLSRGRGYALFLTGGEAVLSLRRSQKSDVGSQENASVDSDSWLRSFPTFGKLLGEPQGLKAVAVLSRPSRTPDHQAPSVLRMKLVGANAHAKVAGLEELPGKANYFIGNDPKEWRTNVATYAKVKYENVYPGVDLVYYGNEGRLEYDFVVAPGADLDAIRLSVAPASSPDAARLRAGTASSAGGAQGPRVAANGDLVVETDSGEVRFHKPVVYQPVASARESVLRSNSQGAGDVRNSPFATPNSELLDGHYVLTADNHVRFEVSGYDKSRPLVIDPVLTYSTYLGGNGNFDEGVAIAADSSGNAYVTGVTNSTNFPTLNPIQATCGSCAGGGTNTNAFVTKINSAGTALVYSTYLGGSGNLDQGVGIAVDSSGNAYVTGVTNSTNFPTVNAFQSALRGFDDAFVTKLNAAGSALVYSTYLGGSSLDGADGIAVDSSGNAYVTGFTYSTNFPTANPFQAALGGSTATNAFVTKFNPAGSALVYSTYLGGSGFDNGFAIAIDSSGNAYVTGPTSSPDFPTVNPIQAKQSNTFVSKLNATGAALVYSTYLGGSGGGDTGNGIAVDSSGNAYVTGITNSTNFPTVNPFQASLIGSTSAFATKLNAAGSALVYSTYLGGSSFGDGGQFIAVDSLGNAYVAGFTSSTNFPILNAIQAVCKNCTGSSSSAFVTKLNAGGNALVYSTYLGGSGTSGTFFGGDFALGIALDSSGNAYVTGTAGSTDFPVVNAIQSTSGGPDDGFVAKISTPVTLSPPGPFAPEVVGTTSSAQAVSLSNTSGASLNLSGIAASGDFAVATNGTTCSTSSPLAVSANCTIDVTFTPAAGGSRTGALTITDSAADSPRMAALVGTGEDFGVASGTSSSATVTAGQPATYTISVSPQGGFNQMVTLNCSGAPFAATCMPSPASVTLDGTNSQNVTVTVTTTKRGMLPPVAVPRNLPWERIALPLFVCLIALMFLAQLARRRQLRPQLAFALLILCAIAWAGCGSSGPQGTPAGTSTLTVTGNSGSLSHKTTVTLVVN